MCQKAYKRECENDPTRFGRLKLVSMQSVQEFRAVRHALRFTRNVGNKGEGRLPGLHLQLYHTVKKHVPMILASDVAEEASETRGSLVSEILDPRCLEHF